MRHFLISETLRISSMDSGPAAIKSLLSGYGFHINYDQLRAACQTEYDSGCIADIEKLAQSYHFETERVFIPRDLLVFSSLSRQPMLVTINSYDDSHRLAVIWQKFAGKIQIMDPASGRRWVKESKLRKEIAIEEQSTSAQEWYEWAQSPAFTETLFLAMNDLGLKKDQKSQFLDKALAEKSWWGMACLDASLRLVRHMVHSGALKKGNAATSAFSRFFEDCLRKDPQTVPAAFWGVGSPQTPKDADRIIIRGAQVLHIKGFQKSVPKEANKNESQTKALSKELLRLLKLDGLLLPCAIFTTLFLEAAGRFIEAFMFRSVLDLSEQLTQTQRIEGFIALSTLILLSAALVYTNSRALLRLGHNFEARLRMLFLNKIPNLGDLYLQTHAISDLADRCHNIHYIRNSVYFGGEIIRGLLRLLVTCLAVALLDFRLLPLVIISALVCIYFPKRMSRAFSEKDMRIRTLDGSMSRFYLDTLVGLIPNKVHGSEDAIRREHEGLLVSWTLSRRSFEFLGVLSNGFIEFAGFFLSITMLFQYLLLHGPDGGALLLLYWVLDIPFTGSRLSHASQRFAAYRSRGIRILEPLLIPDEHDVRQSPSIQEPINGDGVHIRIENATVKFTGHVVLKDVSLVVEPGTHLAVVGPSGAGKSTLSGLILGWSRPSSGSITINNQPLSGSHLESLRNHTAWLDPSTQLWNRTFLENLCYGAPESEDLPIADVIESADLQSLLERLSDGLQSPLGANGGNFSGGEGQRIRFGRSLLRRNAKLVILDEPFRGLDRQKRQKLMKIARQWWSKATLICVTHDVSDTLAFDQVAVVDHGQIIEKDLPQNLYNQSQSRYRQLFDSEKHMLENQWCKDSWTPMYLEKGRLTKEAKS